MATKSKVRLLLSQIEADIVKAAASRMEHDRTFFNGRERAALGRALDKLALGLANARGRDAERGVR